MGRTEIRSSHKLILLHSNFTTIESNLVSHRGHLQLPYEMSSFACSNSTIKNLARDVGCVFVCFLQVLRAIRLRSNDRRGILLTPWSGRVSCYDIFVEANWRPEHRTFCLLNGREAGYRE